MPRTPYLENETMTTELEQIAFGISNSIRTARECARARRDEILAWFPRMREQIGDMGVQSDTVEKWLTTIRQRANEEYAERLAKIDQRHAAAFEAAGIPNNATTNPWHPAGDPFSDEFQGDISQD